MSTGAEFHILASHLIEIVLAELLAQGIAGFSQAVRIEDELVARLEGEDCVPVGELAKQSKRWAAIL